MPAQGVHEAVQHPSAAAAAIVTSLAAVLQDTTLNRFLWVVQFFIGNGFYVALDYDGGQGQIELDRQVVANQTLFAQNWLGLLTAFQSLPTWQNGTLPGKPPHASRCLSGSPQCKQHLSGPLMRRNLRQMACHFIELS